jgi:hypothetical protein
MFDLFLPKNCIKWKGVQTVPKDGCSQDCKSVVSAVLTIKSQNNWTFVRKTNIELRPHYSRSCSAVSLLRILSGAKPMSITLNTKPMDSASSMNLNDLWLPLSFHSFPFSDAHLHLVAKSRRVVASRERQANVAVMQRCLGPTSWPGEGEITTWRTGC